MVHHMRIDGEKVSIIIPIYNQEKYLFRSIPAVIGQTWKNLEIVCVNDGSTDSGREIIESFRNEDERIKVVDKDNGGLVDAIIAGVECASGEYICFLDPDDIIGPDFVSNFMKNISSYDFIAMGYFQKNNHEICEKKLREDKIFDKGEIESLKSCFLYGSDTKGVSNTIFISRWNKLYKRTLVISILDDFKECRNISLGEDSIFTYLILCKANSARTLSAANSYTYDISSANSMMRAGEPYDFIEKACAASDKLDSFMKKYGGNAEQAICLYYFLISPLRETMSFQTSKDLQVAYKYIHSDNRYKKGYKIVNAKRKSINDLVRPILWSIPDQRIYSGLYSFLWKMNKKLTNR